MKYPTKCFSTGYTQLLLIYDNSENCQFIPRRLVWARGLCPAGPLMPLPPKCHTP